MAKYKTYDYRQRVLLPVSLEDQLMPGTLEFAICIVLPKLAHIPLAFPQYFGHIAHKGNDTGGVRHD